MNLIPSKNINKASSDDLKSTKNQMITKEVGSLCHQHKNNKKWILLINNEDSTISTLQQQRTIDTSKVLHINNTKVKINAHNIETALTKGNCSAVVLADNTFQKEQINHLHHCAKLSNTELVLLDNVSGFH